LPTIRPMTTTKQPLTLAQFEQRAFAGHFMRDLNTPLLSVALLALVCAWLMRGHVSDLAILAWLCVSLTANLVREIFVRRMRFRQESHQCCGIVLRIYPYLSLVSGLVWGAFNLMFIDTSDPQPFAQLVAGTITAGLIGLAVSSLSVHLPAFYAFVLPISGAYLWTMLRAGGAEQIVLAGLTVVYLSVIARYAGDSHRVHRETVRLRFENQRLIGDLEKRNTDVESASRNKSLFLAGVSHDLKQPIRAIGLYLGVLQHTDRQNRIDVVDNVVPKMEIALSELHGQVTRLLELSRLEAGALQLRMEPVAILALFTKLHDLFESQARSKGIRLHFVQMEARHLGVVWADKAMLESILQNLISNAIKHTAVGAVYIGPRVRQGYGPTRKLCLEVRDSGCGIPLTQQAFLFDAYRSFDDRLASESHGLGLALAKAQATYLGCHIEVRSQSGCGSTFTLAGLQTMAP
jgi:signal transduction histidine kinase